MPGKSERQRRLARERHLRQQARRAQRARRAQFWTAISVVIAIPARIASQTGNPPAARNVGMPPTTPDSTATYKATIVTNRGNVVIDLLNSKATCTVNSFVYLAAKKYFNNTKCQRLTTSNSVYILQCGDPTGTGSGGPGYKFADENLAGATYPQGTVAMANSGANWTLSRTWPRRAQTTPTAPATATRRSR